MVRQGKEGQPQEVLSIPSGETATEETDAAPGLTKNARTEVLKGLLRDAKDVSFTQKPFHTVGV